MPIFEKLTPPPSLKDMVYKSVKEAILVNNLKSGVFYNEQQIAREFGLSKTPVREALMNLASEGFVIYYPRKGFQIKVLTEKNIREFYQFRRILEMGIIEIITEKLTDRQIEEIERIHSKEHVEIKSNNPAGYLSVDRQFHLFLANLTKNSYFVSALEKIRDLIEWSGFIVFSISERMAENSKEHIKVIKALKSRNVLESKKYMKDHLDSAEEATVSFYNEYIKQNRP